MRKQKEARPVRPRRCKPTLVDLTCWSLPVVVIRKALSSSSDPAANRASCWRRDTEEKDRVTAGSWDPSDIAIKPRVTMYVERHRGGIENGLCPVAGIANQRAGHCINGARRSAEN